ncbi:MAG: class I SAM-dependent methyltransferase [Burkholderiales bacterium]
MNAAYCNKYQSPQAAQAYHDAHRNDRAKQRRTRKEIEILGELLRTQKSCDAILDLPCGGGRLSGPIHAATKLLIEADISLSQVVFACNHSSAGANRVYFAASATEIPLPTNSVDAAVCARLSHHLSTLEQRESLIRELLRIARRFVIVSFADRHSIKNLLRVLSGKAPNPHSMSSREIAGIAKKSQARLAACPSVSLLGSRHRYALLVKDPP